ncbi:hypothetical protein AAF712_007619 [Marasmius tenuissimus]|uniref:Major facilitator superfamily (MFS) profile domain-containing protein n=1 Tax=Marasmius tenuissimus TaxID=585030 RepID=A0ABR2ZVS1_9AGAR
MPSSTTSNEHEHPPEPARLQEVEKTRPAFILTWTEVKLLGIAGVGFFLDAYDLFIINPVATMLQYRLYGGASLPANLEGFMKAGANIGSVIGQFLFGYLADSLGRKAVYGKELMLIILATILCLTTPTGTLSPDSCLIYLGMFRILLGVGVGGDYPMSASVTSDRANLRKRGTMLAYIFSNQGWGSLVGSLVTIIVLECYRHVMHDEGKTSKVDGVWRIVVGLSLIPAFGTLYQRLTMPESKRFEASKNLDEEKNVMQLKEANERTEGLRGYNSSPNGSSTLIGTQNSKEPTVVSVGGVAFDANENPEAIATKKEKAHFGGEELEEFLRYFSEWRHLKLLIGTSVCWFLLDIAFYGINLNQNVVLQQIGFDGKSGSPWEKLINVSTGGIIITALGFVPGKVSHPFAQGVSSDCGTGYYASILTIEILGRKVIQIQGFLMAALFRVSSRFTI